MYAPPSRLIYPITHYTVRLTCDSTILIHSHEQQHMCHVYLSPPRNELDRETDIDTQSQLADTLHCMYTSLPQVDDYVCCSV